MEAFHHLVHIREDLSEDDGVDKSDGAQRRESCDGQGGRFFRLERLLVLEGAVAIETVIVVEKPVSLFAGRRGRARGRRVAVDDHGAWSSLGDTATRGAEAFCAGERAIWPRWVPVTSNFLIRRERLTNHLRAMESGARQRLTRQHH